MKKFIFKSTIFFIVAIICFVSFWGIICSNRNETMRLPENCNIVFLGNSHIECAINDTILKNSFNFSRSAENMEYVYCKAKLLKRYNPQLDTIVIGFDNTLLTTYFSNPGIYHPYYFDTYNFSDLKAISLNCSFNQIEAHISRPFDWLKLYDISISLFNPSVNARYMSNLGGYLYLVRDRLDEAINRQKISNQQENISKRIQINNNSEYFLKKIIKYCNQNDIKLIFLHTPMHNKLSYDETCYKKFYISKFANIKFYDFKDMELPDSCFGDLDHLNYKGARAFSEYLEEKVLHKNNYNNNHNSLN